MTGIRAQVLVWLVGDRARRLPPGELCRFAVRLLAALGGATTRARMVGEHSGDEDQELRRFAKVLAAARDDAIESAEFFELLAEPEQDRP